MMSNVLYFGDNLDILSERVGDGSVDLIYLDPPFNSRVQYNLLFERPNSDMESAQAGAFRDTWKWGEDAEWSFRETMKLGGATARIIDALRAALNESDMMAYLCMMAIRLHVLHAKLKSTGSLFLHCDPTASHYLKIILDAVFGQERFRNEIVWKRSSSHADTKQGMRRCGRIHDVLLYYTKGDAFTWTPVFTPYDESYLEGSYRFVDEQGRRYREGDLTAAKPGGDVSYEWRVKRRQNSNERWAADLTDEYQKPKAGWEYKSVRPYNRRFWAYSKENMAKMWSDGQIVHRSTGFPQFKRYLAEQPGVPLQDLWLDINPLTGGGKERVGYPTQKPLALLERIISMASNKGDLVLDPFCGCGTTVEAAERLRRQWVGIDVAVHAIKVIEGRLADRFAKVNFRVEGMPRDFASAKKLAEKDKYQFQWWANYLFNPHALREQKRGADRGIDGELFFPNGPGRPWGKMLTSVKGGENIGPSAVRDFARVLDRENAEMGLFICLRAPTEAMRREALSMKFANTVHGDLPRLQIVSIEDWFKGKRPMLPPLEHLDTAAFAGRRHPVSKVKRPDPEQPQLPLTFRGGKSAEVERHFNPGTVRTWGKTASNVASAKAPSTYLSGHQPSFDYPLPVGRAAARQQVFLMEEPLLVQPRGPRRTRK